MNTLPFKAELLSLKVSIDTGELGLLPHFWFMLLLLDENVEPLDVSVENVDAVLLEDLVYLPPPSSDLTTVSPVLLIMQKNW